MIQKFYQFMKTLRTKFCEQEPTREQLDHIAQELLNLSLMTTFDPSVYLAAGPGEEVLHDLSICSENGPSLYLVSDGVGISNPPHEHNTWAVIVGIKGVELNILYQPIQHAQVSETGRYRVGSRDYLIMEPHEIHSVRVQGEHPTYHLHLYGKSLSSLPNFASRCYPKPPPLAAGGPG